MKLVTESFVPVALNADRLPDNAAGKFFRTLLKTWPQGLWVVTPEGKVLGFHYHRAKAGESAGDGSKRWVADTLTMVRDAAKAAGPLPVREVKDKPSTLTGRGPRAFRRWRSASGAQRDRVAKRSSRRAAGCRQYPVSMKAPWAAFAPPRRRESGCEMVGAGAGVPPVHPGRLAR